MRIVSLLPSATEIVYALGLEDALVGVTFECDEPARARVDKAILVGGLETRGLTPGAIDAHVRAQVAAGAELYTLDAALLADLDPDLILTQDLCRVCALPAGTVEDALDQLGCRADVLTLDPHSLDDMLGSVLQVADRAGVPDKGHGLVDVLEERLERVAKAVASLEPPRVAVVEWVDPPFSAGHWVPDLVSAAGGRPVGASPQGRSAATTWAALVEASPDVVVVAPCGFHLDGATSQAEQVLADLPPDVPVWAIDADGLVVRPGPRLVDGVDALAWVLHPEAVRRPPDGAVRRVR